MSTSENTTARRTEHGLHRIVVKDRDGYPVVVVSMGGGVLAALVAPLVNAVGTVAALTNGWSVEIERGPRRPS